MADIDVTGPVGSAPLSVRAGANERPAARAESATFTSLRWPLLGTAFLLFELYLYTRWIASGNATPNRLGAAAAPSWMRALMWGHVAIGAVSLPAMIWWFLVRPWRQGRRVTSDGLLMVACMTSFWGDLAGNFFRYGVVYPTVWPNLGSWYNFIPGWHPAGGQNQAEATIFFLPMYAVCMFGFTAIGCAVMRKARRRHPGISKVSLFLIAWLTMAAVDLILEIGWVRAGLFVYPGTVKGLTLFYGHVYQFPVYESIIWGAGWAFLSSVRFHKDDRGETFVERAIPGQARSGARTVVFRFLALAAIANVNLLAYNVVFASVNAHGAPWPRDFTNRPYITGGLCSPQALYACPGGIAPNR